MSDDVGRDARRDVLMHAQGVLGVAQERVKAGISNDPHTELQAVRQMIADAGVQPQPGMAEHGAGKAERAAILKRIDAALAGEGTPSGFDVLTFAERFVQERLKATLFSDSQ